MGGPGAVVEPLPPGQVRVLLGSESLSEGAIEGLAQLPRGILVTPHGHHEHMQVDPSTASESEAQLRLISLPPWRLTASTRAIGLKGIASARSALEGARRSALDHSHGASSAAA